MLKLIKLDRFIAWVLFASMFLYFISGYGMTKGIIGQSFASKLHLSYLIYVVLISFATHTSFAIHLAFKRWRIWDGFGKWFLILFYILFISSFVYVDRFYQPKKENESESTKTVNSTISNQNSVTNPSLKEFTTTELALNDGKNSNPAYVAVDGSVYDLTAVFQNGYHFSHFAGKDLTGAFYSQHAKSALSKYPIVGKLK